MAGRVPYPIKGVDENWSFADQPPLTTREESNMVAIDPTNGRTRGAQRAGTSKWCPDPIVAGKPVREIVTVKQPVDLTTYTEKPSPEVIWSKSADSKGSARAVRLDRQKNSIWLEDTNTLKMRNADGEQVWSIPMPVESLGAFCRIMEVDENDTIYVGVSTAEKSADGRLFTWAATEQDKPPVLLSELELAGVIGDMKYQDGYLYLAVNDHETQRSFMRRVVSADAGAPEIDQEWVLPYPTNSIAVRKDGSIITGSPPNPDRLFSSSGEGLSFVSWTPRDLKNWEERVWSWFDASDIDGNDTGNAAYENLDQIGLWLNKATNSSNRTLWDDLKQTKITQFNCEGGATLRKKSVAGLDSLFFDGGNSGIEGDGLHSHASLDNKNTAPENAFGIFPSTQQSDPKDYEGAYACFLVFRPADDQAAGCLMSDRYHGNNPIGWILQTNFTASGTRPSGSGPVTPGTLALYDGRAAIGVSTGAGPSGFPLPGKWTEAGGTCLVTMLHDNHMNSGLSESEGFRSLLRINGQPIDRWHTNEFYTGGFAAFPPLIAGLAVDTDTVNTAYRFNGHICEVLILRYNPGGTDASSRRPVWGPAYPDTPYVANGDSELERIEGYLAWKWGIGPYLENNDGRGGIAANGYIHPFGPGDLQSPPDPKGRLSPGGVTNSSILTTTSAVLAKWSPGGSLVWAKSGTSESGIGSGLAIDDDLDTIFTVGPYSESGSVKSCIRALLDNGETVALRTPITNIDSDGEYELGPDHVDIQLDGFGNLWVPLYDPGHKITKVGANQLQEASGWGIPGDFALATTNPKQLVLSGDQGAHSIAVSREEIDYGDETIPWVNEVWLATSKTQEAVFTLAAFPSASGNVTIGPVTYQLTLGGYTGQPYQVYWNSSTPSTLENLYHAINGDESQGRFGPGTPANPLVRAVKFALNPTEYAVWVSPLKPGAYEIDILASVGLGAWTPPGNIIPVDLTTPVAHKIGIVDETQDTPASPRLVVTVAVSEGYVKKASTSGVSLPGGIDQSSTPALDPNGVPYATPLFGKLYLVDGKTLLRFTPNKDLLEVFVPDKGGVPPKRVWLLETWRGRLVAFSRDNPWNFWMSRQGKPEDWNYFPPEVTADQATFGNHPNSTTGLCPDIINGFVPITDDLALFGCDSSLWRLTGDPMAGGQIDFISSITGMAPGRAWVIDPHGMIYFFGSRGGVYRVNPFGGGMERISRRRIERATQRVDLSQYRLRLSWDYERDGLLISAVPYGLGGSFADHWFWDEKNDRWSTFQFGFGTTTTVQPTALGLVDGDQVADRSLLLGCEDGYIRTFDNDAFDDDGVTIDSHVIVGPLVTADMDWEARFGGTTVILGEEHHGALLELFAATTWTDPGKAKVRSTLKPGRNRTIMESVRGPAAWVRLRNPWPGQRWSYEVMHMEAARMGDARQG